MPGLLVAHSQARFYIDQTGSAPPWQTVCDSVATSSSGEEQTDTPSDMDFKVYSRAARARFPFSGVSGAQVVVSQ